MTSPLQLAGTGQPCRAYAELQAVSNFSFLTGGSHPDELVVTAKALGLEALGIADRNTLAGVVRAHVAAKEAGLRLLVGARLDLMDALSLICYPTDRAAYGRLCRLLSLGQSRAQKGKCELHLADLMAHAKGQILIVLTPEDWQWRRESAPSRSDHGHTVSACCAVTPSPHETADHCPEALGLEAQLGRMRAALAQSGARLYMAASNTCRGDDRARIATLARLASRLGLPLVATADALYHTPDRRPLQDVLTCIRHGVTIAEAGLRLAPNAERHLKPPAEMVRNFRGHEAAIARTLEIMTACRFSLDELVYEYPDEPVPPGQTAQQHLEKLAREGARERFPEGVPEVVAAALERELALICHLAYAPYFLTVHDIVRFAQTQGILAQGRGSAANSVVCYCLGITAVNPTEIDLLFERFISLERREPPDIDVDFEHERREEVIQYIYDRYGRDRAGLAATVICYRARSAVREVGKVMGLSQDTVAALAGMVWGTRSGDALPEQHVREAGLDPGDPRLAAVLALSNELIGFPRHLSQHVGGFVLTRSPLSEVVPIGNAAMEKRTFVEWDKDDLAALGLLKVDILALGMLSCIRRALDLLQCHHGRRLTLASVPREDPGVYDMLCRADSLGVFQVESRAQMNMLPRLKPRTFYDLVIEVAIVRPGPIQGDMVHPYLRRRDGLEPEVYPAPAPGKGHKDELVRILGKTKGVPLFQEQAMRIAMTAAEFSDAEVNELRKSMATFRRRGTIGQLEEKMISRMGQRGYAPEFATRCFNQIKGFGEYGFPESHAASFAHLVYVSSWLKCHYPDVFACALLNAQPMGFYAPAQIVRDAREHGVEMRAVDINHSQWDATLEPSSPRGGCLSALEDAAACRSASPRSFALRLGLRQVDGLAEAEARKLLAARLGGSVANAGSRRTADDPGPAGPRPLSEPARGRGRRRARAPSLPPAPGPTRPFHSIHDLWQRAGLRLDTLERLAAADGFRSLGLDRRQALWEVSALARARPLPLFAWSETLETGPEPPVQLPQMQMSEHVVNDYQTLRLSLKAHPMSFLRDRLTTERVVACSGLKALRNGAWTAVAGVILVRQRPGSAKGVVFMTIEDETGIANTVIWPKTLERYRRVVMTARLILIRGRIQRHGDIIHVVAGALEDRSADLALLSETDGAAMVGPTTAADEEPRSQSSALHMPTTGTSSSAQARETRRSSGGRHPRDQRVIPKSRDFH